MFTGKGEDGAGLGSVCPAYVSGSLPENPTRVSFGISPLVEKC